MMSLISSSRIVLSLKNNFYIQKMKLKEGEDFYSEFINFKLLKNLNNFFYKSQMRL